MDKHNIYRCRQRLNAHSNVNTKSILCITRHPTTIDFKFFFHCHSHVYRHVPPLSHTHFFVLFFIVLHFRWVLFHTCPNEPSRFQDEITIQVVLRVDIRCRLGLQLERLARCRTFTLHFLSVETNLTSTLHSICEASHHIFTDNILCPSLRWARRDRIRLNKLNFGCCSRANEAKIWKWPNGECKRRSENGSSQNICGSMSRNKEKMIKLAKIDIDLPSEISAPTGIYHRIHTRIDPSEPCNDHRHNFFVFNALDAEARQQIDNEKWQPAHDKHAHHDAQRFRCLLLLGKFRQLSWQREILAHVTMPAAESVIV